MLIFSNLTSERFQGSATSRTVTFPSTPSAGDSIVVSVWRSNGNNSGLFDRATAAGYSELAHHDPLEIFRMIGTVLTREAVGNETDVTVAFNSPTGAEAPDGEEHQVISVAFISGGVHSSLVAQIEDDSSTQWNFPADQLDGSLHIGATQESVDISTLMYPAGDTQITHSQVVGFRNGGISVSGGNIASGVFPEVVNGAFGTVSVSQASTAPVTDVSVSWVGVPDGQEVQPDTVVNQLNVLVDAPNSDIASVTYSIERSDGAFYDPVSDSFIAGFRESTVTLPSGVPATRNLFMSGESFAILEGQTYTYRVTALNVDGMTSDEAVATVVGGVWDNAPDITFTTADNSDLTINDLTPQTPTQNYTFTGNAPANAQDLRLRIVDVTNGLVLTADGNYVADTGTNHKLEVVHDAVNETWSFGPLDLPVGVKISATIETSNGSTTSGSAFLPPGGTTGQILFKASDADGVTAWGDFCDGLTALPAEANAALIGSVVAISPDGDCILVPPANLQGDSDTFFNSMLVTSGQTSTVDLTLPDGSTLAAGNPVPANTVIHYNVDEAGTVVNQASFEIPVPTVDTDTFFMSTLLVAGETATIDLTLPDGSTLAAGDPVPADTVLHYVVDSGGNLISENSFMVGATSTGASTVTVAYQAGDTLAYDVTLVDGTTLTAGNPVPEGALIVSEENPDGTPVRTDSIVSCCHVTANLCDGNGDPILMVVDTVTGDVTYYDATGSVVATPVAPLGACMAAATTVPDPTTRANGSITGDGTQTVFTIAHGLGTTNPVAVTFVEDTLPAAWTGSSPGITIIDANTLTATFGVPLLDGEVLNWQVAA